MLSICQEVLQRSGVATKKLLSIATSNFKKEVPSDQLRSLLFPPLQPDSDFIQKMANFERNYNKKLIQLEPSHVDSKGVDLLKHEIIDNLKKRKNIEFALVFIRKIIPSDEFKNKKHPIDLEKKSRITGRVDEIIDLLEDLMLESVDLDVKREAIISLRLFLEHWATSAQQWQDPFSSIMEDSSNPIDILSFAKFCYLNINSPFPKGWAPK